MITIQSVRRLAVVGVLTPAAEAGELRGSNLLVLRRKDKAYYIYIYIHTYVYTYIYIYICIHRQIRSVCIHICIYIYIYTSLLYTYVYMHTYIYIYIYSKDKVHIFPVLTNSSQIRQKFDAVDKHLTYSWQQCGIEPPRPVAQGEVWVTVGRAPRNRKGLLCV